jgi:hypothetical protein
VDLQDDGSRPYVVQAHFEPLTAWVAESRETVTDAAVPAKLHVVNYADEPHEVSLQAIIASESTRGVQAIRAAELAYGFVVPPNGSIVVPLKIPNAVTPDKQAGRTPVVLSVGTEGGAMAYVMAEACAVRYGATHRLANMNLDGDLAEWADAHWSVLGYPFQERGWSGLTDQRRQPSDGWMELATAIDDGFFYLAARVKDNVVGKEPLTLFFDPRPPPVLGTAGPYYWASSILEENGRMRLGKGETTTAFRDAAGAWRQTDDGWVAELRVPLSTFEREDWPPSGDLGFSLIWRDTDPGATTGCQLFWSEDGQYWSPRWYGVLRLIEAGKEPSPIALPYRVRWQ